LYFVIVIHIPPAGVALDRLARLERLYDGPIPAPLRRWALSGMPPAPPRLEADPGATICAAHPAGDDPPADAGAAPALDGGVTGQTVTN
jgi:hypothetical protein